MLQSGVITKFTNLNLKSRFHLPCPLNNLGGGGYPRDNRSVFLVILCKPSGPENPPHFDREGLINIHLFVHDKHALSGYCCVSADSY